MTTYSTEAAIAAQNAATGAATIVAAAINAGQTTIDEASDLFGTVRDAIFAGTLRIAQETEVGEVVGRGGNKGGYKKSGGGGAKDPGSITVDKGKHAGKTIAQINDADPGYLQWVVENSNNSFLRRVVGEYLSAAA